MTTLHWDHKPRLVEIATISSRVNAALFETFADARCAPLVAAMVQPWSQRVHGEDPHAVFGRNTRNQKAAWQVLVGGISPSRPPSPSASSGSEPTCCGSWHSRLLEPHVAGLSTRFPPTTGRTRRHRTPDPEAKKRGAHSTRRSTETAVGRQPLIS